LLVENAQLAFAKFFKQLLQTHMQNFLNNSCKQTCRNRSQLCTKFYRNVQKSFWGLLQRFYFRQHFQ